MNQERKDEVTMTWIGQDGSEWRELRCWIGRGYRTFTQRKFNGIWI